MHSQQFYGAKNTTPAAQVPRAWPNDIKELGYWRGAISLNSTPPLAFDVFGVSTSDTVT